MINTRALWIKRSLCLWSTIWREAVFEEMLSYSRLDFLFAANFLRTDIFLKQKAFKHNFNLVLRAHSHYENFVWNLSPRDITLLVLTSKISIETELIRGKHVKSKGAKLCWKLNLYMAFIISQSICIPNLKSRDRKKLNDDRIMA